MITLNFPELVGLVGAIVAFTGMLITFIALYSARRHTKYDLKTQQVELDMMRRSLEFQMYELNEKLMATENRWKDVNHLLISAQNRQPDAIEHQKSILPSSLFRSAGINIEDLPIERDLVFVITPFHPTHKKQFSVIAAVCQRLGLRAMRGDEEFIQGEIFPHILKLIARARIIIANIDGRNPNVYYELGIAQALGKTTILIAPKPDDVPFDLRTKRLVLFQSPEDLRSKLQEELVRVVVNDEVPSDFKTFSTP